MGSLHHSAAGFPTGLCAFRLCFFLALLDMRLIIAHRGRLQSALALVSGVGTEIRQLLGIGFRPLHHGRGQGRLQQLHIMHVGPAGDERQRDATGVD